jgi:hypothetical protein
MMKEYKHTQIGYPLILSYLVVLAVVVTINIRSEFAIGAVIALIFIILVISTFATMTVCVDQRMITVRFGLGLVRRRFKLDALKHYQPVRNPWYYFLGMRYTPRGWLFAVSGSSAIELKMKDGKQFRIGTNEPGALFEALDERVKALAR